MEGRRKNTNQPNLPMSKPTTEGFYVYCITSEDGPKRFNVRGIDNKSEVFVLGYKDLGAVVSIINLSDFGEGELKKKLDDLKWTKRAVLNHQRVINKVMDGRTVLPMKFGVIYKTRDQIQNVLGKNYYKFKNLLKSLAEKKEWGVKVYYNQSESNRKIQINENPIKKLKEKIKKSPEGIKFFLQKKIEATEGLALERGINKYSEIFLKRLERSSARYVLNEILSRELTGKQEEMVINAAYLVDDKNFLKFDKELADLKDKYSKNGFLFELSGPWPPYNFVNLDLDKSKQAK